MPVFAKGNRTAFLIDRTLPEVMHLNNLTEKEDLYRLCSMLGELGVDYLEIDQAVYIKIGVPPPGQKFIYRIQDKTDLELCANENITDYLISYEGLLKGLIPRQSAGRKPKVFLEVEVDSISTLESFRKNLPKQESIHAVRLLGMARSLPDQWLSFFSHWKKDFPYQIDVCPLDVHQTATATAFELSASPGCTDFITASFAGIGRSLPFAALEELIVALRVIKGAELKGATQHLPALTGLIKRLTGLSLKETKPILGEKIFNYESGIHAAAIKKNPQTYEPFNPSMVGLKRKQVIGKHSGGQAINNKLTFLVGKELPNISDILDEIRAKSIELGRSLTDYELLQLAQGK